MMDDRCEGCRGDAITIVVKRSAFGWAMYAMDAVAAALIFLYVANLDLKLGFASFMSNLDYTLFLVLVFGLIIGSFIMAALDIGRTNQEARRIVEERKGRWKD